MFLLPLTLALFLGSNGKRIPVIKQIDKPLVQDHNTIENDWEDEMCWTALNRLNNGPETPDDYNSTNMFTDTTFEGEDQLYWEGYYDYSNKLSNHWRNQIGKGNYEFNRISSSGKPLFDSEGPLWNDVI